MIDSTELECDIAIIGGGLGGVAAALAAVDAGATVLLSDEYAWLGGQITSQGVSALDEHEHIEQFGGTATYNELRQRIRRIYQERYNAPASMPDGKPLNPGNGWVSRLCFEPGVGLAALEEMLAPRIATGRLTILSQYKPTHATVTGDQIQTVTLSSTGHEQKSTVVVRASYFLDASETGDLLPLTGAEYTTGSEARADTDEEFAAEHANPDEVQSFTYCFAVEFCPGEHHLIAKPAGYEAMRDQQPYSLTLIGQDGAQRPFRMFSPGPTGLPPFWTYRRMVDHKLLNHPAQPNDIALINWHGNDYHGGSILDKCEEARTQRLHEAKQLALGFLYWLQTEVRRDDGGVGYPELKLRPDIMGTADGLSQAPYIRESRRILARRRIVEKDVRAAGNPLARARCFTDSCGIGWYPLDLHAAVGNPRNLFEPTKPYQISLGALIPRRMSNLLAANKNIGVTHVSNGAYRLHPVEWAIGEAAGSVAAFCCQRSMTPAQLHASMQSLRHLQRMLAARGIPLVWMIDISPGDPLFVTSQMLGVAGAITPNSRLATRLEIRPDDPLNELERISLLLAAQELTPGKVSALLLESATWRDFCRAYAPILDQNISS